MHSGSFKSGRTAQRTYHGSRRPIRIKNLKIRRDASREVQLCFDMEFDDLWRYPKGEEPGNWNAAWMFVKFRSTRTTEGCTEADLINKLAPTGHLPGDLADEQRAGAEKSFRDAMRQLARAPKIPSDEDGDDSAAAPLTREQRLAMAMKAGPQSFSASAAAEKLPPAEPATDLGERILNLTKTHVVQGYGAASPGSTTAQVDHVSILCRPDGEGGHSFDYKEMTLWQHAMLSTSSADHTAPSGMEIEAADDGMGVVIHRSAANPGASPTEIKDVMLRWKAPSDMEFPVRVWVHGVEMVYVPKGAFELGDPRGLKGPSACFHASQPEVLEGGSRWWTWKVDSEDEIPVCDLKETPGGENQDVPAFDRDKPPVRSLTWDNRGQWGDYGDIPAHFPKGHDAFYCMRRQVTQGDFADFINSLFFHAKSCRFPYGGQGDYRYTVFKTESGQRAATRPNRANNWMSWADAMAWLWWAGLRPMTEFEYEKACRGMDPAVPNEFAWGSTTLETALVVRGDEGADESLPSNCNINNALALLQGGDAESGPVRDDAFALQGTGLAEAADQSGYAVFPMAGEGDNFASADPGLSRQTTGSTYYGIMGMSGNLWEFTVCAGNHIGRGFSGVHGNGELDEMGLPGREGDDFPWSWTDAEGMGFRGGSWYTSWHKGRIADRVFSSGIKYYDFRSHDTGVRGVRTCPGKKK